jgi:HK97 family phage major capsid protein
MAIEVTSGNTTLLQSQVAQLLVQPLEQASTFLAAGPTILDSSSQVRIPRIASGVTAGFVAEGSQIGDGDVTFDEVTLLPSTLKSIKTLIPVSNELLRQSVVGLDTVLRQRLITDVASALDAALWDGAGTSNTIKGIFRATGVATGALDLTDADSLIDGLATAQANHVTPTHWVMTSDSFAALRKLKIANAGETSDQDFRQYLFDPSGISGGTAFQLFGLSVIVTDYIPKVSTKARVALVDMSKVVVVRDLDSDVFISPHLKADYDTVIIRVVTRMDTALLQAHGVTVLTEA